MVSPQYLMSNGMWNVGDELCLSSVSVFLFDLLRFHQTVIKFYQIKMLILINYAIYIPP